MSKWSCPSCTYDNYPATQLCILCRTAKPNPRIEDDIYKLALTSPTTAAVSTTLNTSSVSFSNEHANQEPAKWMCTACTFCNWPRSRRCVQCLNARTRRGVPATVVNSVCPPQSSNLPLRVNVNVTTLNTSTVSTECDAATADSAGGSRRLLPRGSTSATLFLGKWICRQCTYENWPRSHRCVICQIPRSTSENVSFSPLCSLSDNVLSAADSGLEGACANAANDCDKSGGGALTRLYNTGLKESDYLWLCACLGAVEGEVGPVDAYLATGGSPARRLVKSEASLLNRHRATAGLSRVFEAGLTLSHLVFRHSKHEDLMALLLAAMDRGSGLKSTVNSAFVKRVPCHTSPELACEIRRHLASCLRQRKGAFPCFFLTESNTFFIPSDIEDLPSHMQDQLLLELVDHDVQRELEEEEACINWSDELARSGWKLLALWNRTAGDCLLDSVLQATWGVLDRDNGLRWALAESLREAADALFARWQPYEAALATLYNYTLDEHQWRRDWNSLLESACRPGDSLEQIHVLTLAHVLRRPIIVYGVKLIHNYRAEPIGVSHFQGVYLPLLWERQFCWRSPLLLGYTRGHFSALVPVESLSSDVLGGAGGSEGAGAALAGDAHNCQFGNRHEVWLPLQDCHGKLLPVHFLHAHEFGREESLLWDWLDCGVTKQGLLCARLRVQRQHSLVHQLSEEWIDHYRRSARVFSSPVSSNCSSEFSGSRPLSASSSPPPPPQPPSAPTLLLSNSSISTALGTSGTWPRSTCPNAAVSNTRSSTSCSAALFNASTNSSSNELQQTPTRRDDSSRQQQENIQQDDILDE